MGQSGTFFFTHLRLHYHQEKIRIGDLQNDLKKKISPPGLDGSMKKMPHLSKWSNEFAGYDHYTFFFFNLQNVSLRPAHSSHTLFSQSSDRHPVKLSHSNFYFNILGQGVKKYQVSSLLVFYDTSWETEA